MGHPDVAIKAGVSNLVVEFLQGPGCQVVPRPHDPEVVGTFPRQHHKSVRPRQEKIVEGTQLLFKALSPPRDLDSAVAFRVFEQILDLPDSPHGRAVAGLDHSEVPAFASDDGELVRIELEEALERTELRLVALPPVLQRDAAVVPRLVQLLLDLGEGVLHKVVVGAAGALGVCGTGPGALALPGLDHSELVPFARDHHQLVRPALDEGPHGPQDRAVAVGPVRQPDHPVRPSGVELVLDLPDGVGDHGVVVVQLRRLLPLVGGGRCGRPFPRPGGTTV
mmetsp:Transcript_104136/g.333989  ORF Transcript_104136/g.333989 Transcript_104136/m.333989 type:complete len:279 (-) Transcript_104136:876-1712(-)